ncbi:hypothetical protein L3Q82_001254 [Scortum barcoo]|uniref:Uncharacterized protein n=1 Tax=Scortum barcoo TaxID=214431 RepID=A0ACB8W6J5_9TELE|nr:hypothetical protein L3Q82_001254 [Scortum barcoo]
MLPTMANYITSLDVSLDEANEQNLQSKGFFKIYADLNKGAGGNSIYLWSKVKFDNNFVLPTMANYITSLDVSLDEAEEQLLQSKGFSKIDADLNKGAGGKNIYLWYKKESCSAPITRLQVTFNNDMAVGLINAGYTKIDKNLNAGAGGDYIYLWYFSGSGVYDTPIVDIDVTTSAENEAQKFRHGWERVTCDLNRKVGGNWIHVWVKRESQTYICDVSATDSYGSDTDYFQDGYIRMDEDTNRGAGGSFVFIWYRQTTDSKRALTNVQISTNDREYQSLQQQHYHSVSVNLNEGTRGNKVYLWYKKQACNPIKAVTLLVNMAAVDEYEKAGVSVIKKNLNTGTDGIPDGSMRRSLQPTQVAQVVQLIQDGTSMRAVARRFAVSVRRSTARALQNDLQQATNVHVSAQTVRNRLHEGEFVLVALLVFALFVTVSGDSSHGATAPLFTASRDQLLALRSDPDVPRELKRRRRGRRAGVERCARRRRYQPVLPSIIMGECKISPQ